MDQALWQRLQALTLEEVQDTLAALPHELRQKAQPLPVALEPLPNSDLQADGIAPDTLGLFVGPDYANQDNVPLPPQILLYLENLWDQAEHDEDSFRDEVHTTYLHELGHYLGLDEDDLSQRGLD